MSKANVRIVPGLVAVAATLLLPTGTQSCSWDNDIWPKHPTSDTALFRVVSGDQAGYIDRSGKMVIPYGFPSQGNHGFDDFFEGIASVDLLRPRFIDESGRVFRSRGATPVPYQHFSAGRIPARACSKRKCLYGFLDRQGALAVPVIYDAVSVFSEGLAAVHRDGWVGFIDPSGRMVVPHRFLIASEYAEGVVRVVESGPCRHYGYGPCANANPIDLGVDAPVKGPLVRCLYSYVDRRGHPLFAQRFREARDFSEGLAAAGEFNLWGFIDKTGQMRIPMIFEDANSFHEGLAAVRKDVAWGYIDRTGKFVIPPVFQEAGDFSDGAAVVTHQKAGIIFIDRQGRRLFRRSFLAATPFRLGLAHVREANGQGWMDRAGRMVYQEGRSAQ